METNGRVCSSLMARAAQSEEEMEVRRGPWTVEEDLLLISYIENHGEGHWNILARNSGLKRTGKSCRLRWLNYLRPDVRRGNITPEEQLLILELQSRWGNRWSKIAELMPGRTDNEIKNYWRTKVQKHANQLRCDVNSKKFKDVMRNLWMPRLVERIVAASSLDGCPSVSSGQPKQCPVEEMWMSSSSNSSSNVNGYYLKDGEISNLDEIQLDYSDGWPNMINLDKTLVDDGIWERDVEESLRSFEDGG